MDVQLANAVAELSLKGFRATEDIPSDPFAAAQLSMLCSTHSYLVFKIRELLKDAVARTADVQYSALLAEASSRARAELKRLAMHVKVRTNLPGTDVSPAELTGQIIHMLDAAPGPLLWIHFTRL